MPPRKMKFPVTMPVVQMQTQTQTQIIVETVRLVQKTKTKTKTIQNTDLKSAVDIIKPLKIPKPKKLKTDTKRDVGDPHYDLIKVFENKNIGIMDDDELKCRIENLQNLRLIRVTTSKKKTALDMILSGITVEKARLYLEVLAVNNEKEKGKDS
jgi:Glu-tRNA(Gln) amidotransferase subunit E-like FAD-binding protein